MPFHVGMRRECHNKITNPTKIQGGSSKGEGASIQSDQSSVCASYITKDPILFHMSLGVRKQAYCICENKRRSAAQFVQ